MNNETITPDYEIVVTWKLGQDTNKWWTQTCCDIMEVFGLPGYRYESSPTADYMRFTFKNKKDADLCRILLSEKI